MINPREFTDYCIGQSTYMEQGKPRMELSEIAAAQFAGIVDVCAKRAKAVVGVVRRWDASKEELMAFYHRMQEIKHTMPELAGVIFPVNDDADKNHQTSRNLDELIAERQIKHLVAPVRIQNYSWTAGLNGPAALLYHGLKKMGASTEGSSVFNLSFHTEFDESQLEKLAGHYRNHGLVIATRKDGPAKPNISLRMIADAFSGTAFAEEILYIARNTSFIVPLADIARLKGYSALCNGIGWMEDHEFAARLLFDALTHNDQTKVGAMLSSLRDPVYYTDAAWESLSAGKKRAKLDREIGAVKAIAKNLALLNGASYETPVEDRDFRFG
ncbi:MAG TPA: hypothetical protein HA362_06640 [Nanoarchaeota archaeon]|nr:hypothetical protein [Nanoarchaeota archaeon]